MTMRVRGRQIECLHVALAKWNHFVIEGARFRDRPNCRGGQYG